jgi:hypothetical protein
MFQVIKAVNEIHPGVVTVCENTISISTEKINIHLANAYKGWKCDFKSKFETALRGVSVAPALDNNRVSVRTVDWLFLTVLHTDYMLSDVCVDDEIPKPITVDSRKSWRERSDLLHREFANSYPKEYTIRMQSFNELFPRTLSELA